MLDTLRAEIAVLEKQRTELLDTLAFLKVEIVALAAECDRLRVRKVVWSR